MVRRIVLLMGSFLATVVLIGGELPSFQELKPMIRREHPRLFLTPETLRSFKTRAGELAELVADYKKQVDAAPDKPELTIKPGTAEVRDGKLLFLKSFSGNMQNDGTLVIQEPGGHLSIKSAIVFLATGDRRYLEKATRYMLLAVEFAQWCNRYDLIPEWWHSQRLSALVAYDWLFDELSPENRRKFIVPMMQHVRHMQTVKYFVCRGVPHAGNYGEPGLLWFAGLAGYGDGIDDPLAEELLQKGYAVNRSVMDYREKVSSGSGLLGTTVFGYSLGFYPYASCNFLLTAQSGAGLDLRGVYPQMRDYPTAVYYQLIPDFIHSGKLCGFGWGDEYHFRNRVNSAMLYSHMAHVIHLFPESAAKARAVIGLLPEKERAYLETARRYAFLPFVLTGFDPKARLESSQEAFGGMLATHFSAFGVTVMRSGDREGATYASFKGGARESNHQHFDENSFILYKKGFQALDTGERGLALHNGVYYVQSIAHNTMLIRMKNEPIGNLALYPKARNMKAQQPLWSDGGQYRKAVARPLTFDQSAYHVSAGSDASRCYSPEKCKEAVRQFVFLKPDFFVIYDRVESVKPDQQKVFLLHTQNEPVLKNGVWRGEAGEGAVFLRSLLPDGVRPEVIGGRGREFFTNNRNWEIHNQSQEMAKPNWFGRYRLELTAPTAHAKTRFLTFLQTADASTGSMIAVERLEESGRDGVFFTYDGNEYRIFFNRDGAIGGSVEIRRNGTVLLQRKLSE